MCAVEATRTASSRRTRNNKGVRRATCVLAKLRAHYTTHANPKQKERRGEKKGEESREQRVVLDGGGARLADAATRHHLTRTRTQTRTQAKKGEEEENNSEQNKHKRTQTIQKTSTRPGPSNGHHTLPSMRSKTPIQQQRGTQIQLSRGRPHNPSLVRRNQPPGQRTSAMRQMQQQTRQRQTRQRQSTPLPEKR